MADERDQGSVLMLPPGDEERELLDHAREKLAVPPDLRERVRARLDSIDDLAIQRAKREARRRTALRVLAVAATLALALLGGRLALRGVIGTAVETPPTMVVMTGADQHQVVTPVDGVDVEVRPETQVTVLPGDPETVLLVLAEGEVVVDYRRGAGGPPLKVQAGDVAVRVTGTRFAVARAADRVSVDVDRGSVVVSWPGGEADLGAGGTWRSWPDEVAVAVAEAPAIELDEPGLALEPDPATAPIPVDAPPTAASPAAEPDAPEAGGPEVALAQATPEEIPDEASLFARIQLERGAGVPAADRLEDLDRFLAAYPDSAFGEEIRALRIEALADTGQDTATLQAASAFCERHGEGARRRQVRWIEARVAHGRLDDCERALPAYRELAAGTGPRVGEAMYGLGVCAYETGRVDEARDALRAATAFELDAEQQAHAHRLLEALE